MAAIQWTMGILVVSCTLFSGCANSVKYKVGGEPLQTHTSITVIDNRDMVQKKAKIMSLSQSSCWYGIYRVGDDQILPGRLETLAEEVEKRLGKEASPETVVVRRFEIFSNIQRDLRNTVFASQFGLAGLLLRKHIKAGGCEDGFNVELNPENKPSVIVLVDIDVGGKTVVDKWVQLTPMTDKPESLGSVTMRARIEKAVLAAAARIADSAAVERK